MKKLVLLIRDMLFLFYCVYFYFVELWCLMYLRLLYLMFVAEIEFSVLQPVLYRVKDNSCFRIRTH